MKELIISVMLLMTAVFGLRAAPQPDSLACNIAVGHSTVMAVYPDQLEVVIHWDDMTAEVVTFDQDGCPIVALYAVDEIQRSPIAWVASWHKGWVEVNVQSGTTIYSADGSSSAFFLMKNQ